MSRRFFVISVITAMFFAAVVSSCDKDMENLLEIVKNENGETKAVFDEQNRITKVLYFDKKDDVFKKTTFTYGDGSITVKIEESSYDEYLAIGEFRILDDKIILKTDKKIIVEF